MMDLSRMQIVIGDACIERLKRAHVAVFGLGGVGSFAAEAIARAGVGSITLVDKDIVDASNINRQLYALHSTVGQKKVEIAKRRILESIHRRRYLIIWCFMKQIRKHNLI